jgi:succinate-acetate transporter protein
VVTAGGAVVLLFAILAWYHAAGEIIESTFGRKLLPFGPAPLR